MRMIYTVLVLCSTMLGTPPGVHSEPAGMQLFPCAMTRYSTPIKLSGVLGLSFNNLQGRGSYHGFFAQLEPGFGGGKVNLGYRFGRMQFMPLWNIGLSASLLRTWGDPLDDIRPNQTYLGPELSGAFSMVGLNAGALRHLSGDEQADEWVYTMGVGVGF